MKTALYLTMQIFVRMFLAPLLIALGLLAFGFNFWGSFAIAFAINLLAGLGYNSFISSRNKGLELSVKEKEIDFQNKMMDMQKNQSIQVPCAYCGVSNTIPLSISVGSFICDGCKKKNRLFLNFRTARITDVGNDSGPFGSVEIPVQTVSVGSI